MNVENKQYIPESKKLSHSASFIARLSHILPLLTRCHNSYQFNPHLLQPETVTNILAKALTVFPSPYSLK